MSTRRGRPPALQVVATASLISVAFMGSVVITPLYSAFQRELGFSDITLTLVYAIYVVGNVAALLSFGQVSDQVGRRRAAVPGLLLAAASAVVFLCATSTAWLFVGRFLIGLAVGILSGTGTAWLAEVYGDGGAAAATVAATTANLTGIALGPLLAGLLAQYAPWPLVLPFVAYLVLVALVGVGVARTPQPRPPQVRRLRDVRVHPALGVPADRLREFAAPAVTGFVTFALGGLYFALMPNVVIRDLRIDNLAVGGLVVCELGAVAAVGIVLGRRVPTSRAMVIGLVALLPAVVLVVAAQAAASLALLLVATVFAGLTLSFGYRGSLQVVNAIAPPDRRAEVASSYFIACFLGNSVPVIGVGVLSAATDPVVASAVFAATVAVLAVGALTWYVRLPS